MKEFKLIVAGGRDFTDAEHLSRVLFAMADVEFADRKLVIVTAYQKESINLGQEFADANGLQHYSFVSPDEQDVCLFSDGLLAFVNRPEDAAQLRARMLSLHKPVTVIQY